MNRHTIIEAAAELDTLSHLLGEANDTALLNEIRDRLHTVLTSITPHTPAQEEGGADTTADPTLITHP